MGPERRLSPLTVAITNGILRLGQGSLHQQGTQRLSKRMGSESMTSSAQPQRRCGLLAAALLLFSLTSR
jgi:hypothetical protein